MAVRLNSPQQVRLSCGAAAGCVQSDGALVLDVKSMFDSWFIADTLYGSTSTLYVPFFPDRSLQGTITIRLTNRFGASNVLNHALQAP